MKLRGTLPSASVQCGTGWQSKQETGSLRTSRYLRWTCNERPRNSVQLLTCRWVVGVCSPVGLSTCPSDLIFCSVGVSKRIHLKIASKKCSFFPAESRDCSHKRRTRRIPVQVLVFIFVHSLPICTIGATRHRYSGEHSPARNQEYAR